MKRKAVRKPSTHQIISQSEPGFEVRFELTRNGTLKIQKLNGKDLGRLGPKAARGLRTYLNRSIAYMESVGRER